MHPLLDNLLQRTERLCRISSPTGDLEGAAALLAELVVQSPDGAKVKQMGPTSLGAGPDLLISINGRGRGGALLLGHYDTVPAAAGTPEWQISGDKVYGCGAFDMKGGLAMIMQLLEDYSQRPDSFSTIHALIMGDEEWRDQPPLYRHSPWVNTKGALCFEGGNPGYDYSIVSSRHGADTVVAKISAPMMRAQYPMPQVSSLEWAAQLISRCDSLNQEHFPGAQLIATGIDTDAPINATPEEVSVRLQARFADRRDLEAYLSQLGEGMPVEWAFQQRMPPWTQRPEAAVLLGRLRHQFNDLHIEHRMGSSDACWFAESFPVVFDGLGPSGAGEHSAHEYLSIPSMPRQYSLAKSLMDMLTYTHQEGHTKQR